MDLVNMNKCGLCDKRVPVGYDVCQSCGERLLLLNIRREQAEKFAESNEPLKWKYDLDHNNAIVFRFNNTDYGISYNELSKSVNKEIGDLKDRIEKLTKALESVAELKTYSNEHGSGIMVEDRSRTVLAVFAARQTLKKSRGNNGR